MNDPFDLTGQVAFVTGASAGLGDYDKAGAETGVIAGHQR
jgi:NADP-dependent 3-hydroxy acid dehydrogenase YdfG